MLITKLYNNTQHPMKNEILRDDAMYCHGFYSCETNVPLTKAAMMFHTHPPGCSTRPIVWLTNQLTCAYMGALTQGLVPGGTQTRAMMKDHLENRAAAINDYYKESLFKPTDVQKIRSNVNMYLCEDTDWRSLVTYQKDREGHKQRWEIPGVGAGLFFHLRRKMFGENQQVDPDDVGNQDEGPARRAIYATRKLIVSVGRLVNIDEIGQKTKGGKSSGRESSRTERRDESPPPRKRSRRGEREESRHDDDRDRAGKGKGRDQSRKGGQRERGTKHEGKRGGKQRLSSEGGRPGGEASWGDYRPPPADRDRTRGRDGGRRDEQSETETRQTERSRSVREPTVSFRSPQRENEDTSGIRMPARTTETGAETILGMSTSTPVRPTWEELEREGR